MLLGILQMCTGNRVVYGSTLLYVCDVRGFEDLGWEEATDSQVKLTLVCSGVSAFAGFSSLLCFPDAGEYSSSILPKV